MDIVIRESVLTDLNRAWELNREVFKEDSWTLLDTIGAFSSPGVRRFTALADGQFAGFGASEMDRKNNAVFLLTLAVLPKYQRRGIGRLLLKHIEETYGTSDVYLYVDEQNTDAIRLYEKAGYKHTGMIRSYYLNGHNALIMKKQNSETENDIPHDQFNI